MNKDTDMTIQERLRGWCLSHNIPEEAMSDLSEAADHIDQLEADKAELVEALGRWVRWADSPQLYHEEANAQNFDDALTLTTFLLTKHKRK